MPRIAITLALAVGIGAGVARDATAVLHPGDPAFEWTKTELGTGALHSQSEYLGKVVVLFLLGYN